nr:hypothetical protein [Tanacetum cinerariifolium]
SAAATEQPSQERNEEWLNVMVDTTDEEMVDVTSDLRFASSGYPNVIVSLSVKKEKEITPPNSQDVPMTTPVDA